MRAFFLTTETNETPKYAESLACVDGFQVKHHIFSHINKRQSIEALELEIGDAIKDYESEVVVYLGGCGGHLPSAEFFAKVNRDIPTVLMCSDAGDAATSPWGPLLRLYDHRDSFRVVVAIDGNRNWEFSDRHLTLLTPIDPTRYPDPPIPHAQRRMVFGFAGNIGNFRAVDKHGTPAGRRPHIAKMQEYGLQYRDRDNTFDPDLPHSQSYQNCCDFLSQCRITPNFSETGSYESHHVKGRVIEVGLAGGMLLEEKGAPTYEWFERGVDYLEWETDAQAKSIVEAFKDKPDETQAMGLRLRKKVLENHNPTKFWTQVMAKI